MKIHFWGALNYHMLTCNITTCQLQVIDPWPFESGPYSLTSSLLLVSPSEWDQHLHDLITGRGEEQFVFVFWPYGPISRVTTPQSLQDTHLCPNICVCLCSVCSECNDLGDPPGHLTLPPVATYADEASSCAICLRPLLGLRSTRRVHKHHSAQYFMLVMLSMHSYMV